MPSTRMCSVQSIASHTEDDYIAFIIVASMKQTTKAMVGINNEANNFTNTQEYLLFYSTEKAKQSTFSSFKKSYVQTRVYFRHVAIISSILPFPKWQTTEDFRTWKALNRLHLLFSEERVSASGILIRTSVWIHTMSPFEGFF